MQGGTTTEVGFQVFIHLIRFPIKHWFLYEPRGCHVKLSQCSRATPLPVSSETPYSYSKSRVNLAFNLVLFDYPLIAFTWITVHY